MDYGPTVPEEKREIIFERGAQLDSGDTRGRGLGLAIAKRIANAHYAEVGVLPNKPMGNICLLKIPKA